MHLPFAVIWRDDVSGKTNYVRFESQERALDYAADLRAVGLAATVRVPGDERTGTEIRPGRFDHAWGGSPNPYVAALQGTGGARRCDTEQGEL